LREAAGPEADIAVDFHGAVPPPTAKLLIKALEPHQPFFIEEPVQCQNVDVMADIARGTHLPIAAGERIFTKWGWESSWTKRPWPTRSTTIGGTAKATIPKTAP
jgi:galactonate dehydratase